MTKEEYFGSEEKKNPIRCGVCDGPFGGTIYKDRVLGLVCADCAPHIYLANGLLNMNGPFIGIREPKKGDKIASAPGDQWRENRFGNF